MESFLRDGSARGIFFTGGQAYVEVDGQVVLDEAYGESAGQRVRTDTVHRLYCSAKPVTAAVVLLCAAEGLFDLDDPIASHLPVRRRRLGDTPIRCLLDHTAGLHHLRMHTVFWHSYEQRLLEYLRAEPPDRWRSDLDLAYSEVAAFGLLVELVQRTSGLPAQVLLDELILEPAGISDLWYGLPDAVAADEARVGLNFDFDGPVPEALLHEVLPQSRRVVDATNVYGTAASLGRFYGWICDQPALEAMRRSSTSMRPDVAMRRWCSYGMGTMTDLSSHAFGTYPSRRAFGHTGFKGSYVGFCDPDARLVCVYGVNGIFDARFQVDARRPGVISRLYEDLGIDELNPGAPPLRVVEEDLPMLDELNLWTRIQEYTR